MSEAPEQHQPVQRDAVLTSSSTEQPPSQDTPPKRPASDDDIEFVSSNPVVKKRRLSEQKPALILATAQGTMPPPPPPAPTPSPKHHTTLPSHPAPVHRFHSLGGAGHSGGPSSSSTPPVENRGASLPVFRNFEFPQSLPVSPSQRPRASEAISPKQLPQALQPSQASQLPQTVSPPPEVCVSTTNPVPLAAPTPPPPSQNSVTIGEISCLDVNGVPTNTPGFDASRVFVPDGGIMGGLGMNTAGTVTSAANVFKSQNAIPFAMYSTGSFVPMAQMHGIAPQTPAAFSNQTGNTDLTRSPSPTPGPKPPCLHCAQIRQQTLMRQAQGTGFPHPPAQAASHSRPAGQYQPQHQHHNQHHHHHHHHHHPPPAPAINHQHHHHPPPPPAPQTGAIPHSTPPTPRPPTSAPPPTTTPRQPQHQPQPPRRPMTPSPPRPNPSTTSNIGSNNLLLLQDVIQTVHDCFPYAPVAARHGVLPARVAEVLAGVVVPPPAGVVGRGGWGGRMG